MIKEKNVKLVIIDSLMSEFRSDYIGRGKLAERQQKINKHMHALQKLADVHNLAVYVTNQVMDKPDMLFGDPTVPVGGNVIAHQCLTGDTLVQLSNGAITEIKNIKVGNDL